MFSLQTTYAFLFINITIGFNIMIIIIDSVYHQIVVSKCFDLLSIHNKLAGIIVHSYAIHKNYGLTALAQANRAP